MIRRRGAVQISLSLSCSVRIRKPKRRRGRRRASRRFCVSLPHARAGASGGWCCASRSRVPAVPVASFCPFRRFASFAFSRPFVRFPARRCARSFPLPKNALPEAVGAISGKTLRTFAFPPFRRRLAPAAVAVRACIHLPFGEIFGKGNGLKIACEAVRLCEGARSGFFKVRNPQAFYSSGFKVGLRFCEAFSPFLRKLRKERESRV